MSCSIDNEILVPISHSQTIKTVSFFLLGEAKESTEFAKAFLERRSKYKNQQRAANAHIDDMCSPAPAITPVNDAQEAKVSAVAFLLISLFPFFIEK